MKFDNSYGYFESPDVAVIDVDHNYIDSYCYESVDVPVVDFLNLSEEKIDTMFSKSAAATIKKAKSQVEGDPDCEKTASAAITLSTLPDGVGKVLLGVLADTTW